MLPHGQRSQGNHKFQGCSKITNDGHNPNIQPDHLKDRARDQSPWHSACKDAMSLWDLHDDELLLGVLSSAAVFSEASELVWTNAPTGKLGSILLLEVSPFLWNTTPKSWTWMVIGHTMHFESDSDLCECPGQIPIWLIVHFLSKSPLKTLQERRFFLVLVLKACPVSLLLTAVYFSPEAAVFKHQASALCVCSL